MPRYEIRIRWSSADEAFIAWVPELPRCMAHGPTRADALKNAEGAMQAMVEVAQEIGRALPVAKDSNDLEWVDLSTGKRMVAQVKAPTKAGKVGRIVIRKTAGAPGLGKQHKAPHKKKPAPGKSESKAAAAQGEGVGGSAR